MPPIRLMIVEDNDLQRELYLSTLAPWSEIQVVYAARNGADALVSIKQLHPDVVLFDVVMPHMDGFALLEKTVQWDAASRPAMIALTSLGRDDFITRAVSLGVDDYLVKPVEPEQLASRIKVLHQLRLEKLGLQASRPLPPLEPQPAAEPDDEAQTDDGIRKFAAKLLMQLGMPAHLYGYQYLMEAIVLTVQDPSMINRVTTALYPAVAEACGATASRVERSIRNAIAITWDRGGGIALSKLLGRTGTLPAAKPSNSELIAQLSARIRMKERK